MVMSLPLLVLGAALAAAAILLAITLVLWFRLRAKLSETRQALEETAVTDALTGIPNHKHLLSRFEEEFQKCRRYKGGVGCVLIDIDHFKRINAVHGHHAGDRVLRKLAKLVKSSIRSYDVLGRYGDEEFLALVPGGYHPGGGVRRKDPGHGRDPGFHRIREDSGQGHINQPGGHGLET